MIMDLFRLAFTSNASETVTEALTETTTEAVTSGGETAKWAGIDLYNFLMRTMDIEPNSTEAILFLFLGIFLCIISAYLIGSINPSIIISRRLYKEDIRSFGSGNAGTTNTLRTYGTKIAVLVFLLDLLKAAVAVILGSFIVTRSIGGAIAGLFVVLGHMFPIYYKFKGGKGVACGAMVMLIISPYAFVINVAVFILIVLLTRYISLGSIICAMLFPMLTVVFQYDGFIPMCALIIGALIVFMHRANIKRISERKESKFSFKKTDKHKVGENANTQDNSGSQEDNKKVNELPPVEKEYTDADFVKCSCGRLIPVSRKICAYCDTPNPKYIPKENGEKGGKKKKK